MLKRWEKTDRLMWGDKAMYAPIWELGFVHAQGPPVAESGLGLITGWVFAAPYEEEASTMRRVQGLVVALLILVASVIGASPSSAAPEGQENFTSSAVTGSPLWNRTPLRRTNSYARPSCPSCPAWSSCSGPTSSTGGRFPT